MGNTNITYASNPPVIDNSGIVASPKNTTIDIPVGTIVKKNGVEVGRDFLSVNVVGDLEISNKREVEIDMSSDISGRFGDGSDGTYDLDGDQDTVAGLFTRDTVYDPIEITNIQQADTTNLTDAINGINSTYDNAMGSLLAMQFGVDDFEQYYIITAAGHGLSDNDDVFISGCSDDNINGMHRVIVIPSYSGSSIAFLLRSVAFVSVPSVFGTMQRPTEYSLVRDAFFETLSVQEDVILFTKNFRIFARTINLYGIIDNSGLNAASSQFISPPVSAVNGGAGGIQFLSSRTPGSPGQQGVSEVNSLYPSYSSIEDNDPQGGDGGAGTDAQGAGDQSLHPATVGGAGGITGDNTAGTNIKDTRTLRDCHKVYLSLGVAKAIPFLGIEMTASGIQVTTSGHGLSTGDRIRLEYTDEIFGIRQMGDWKVTVDSSSLFTLDNSLNAAGVYLMLSTRWYKITYARLRLGYHAGAGGGGGGGAGQGTILTEYGGRGGLGGSGGSNGGLILLVVKTLNGTGKIQSCGTVGDSGANGEIGYLINADPLNMQYLGSGGGGGGGGGGCGGFIVLFYETKSADIEFSVVGNYGGRGGMRITHAAFITGGAFTASGINGTVGKTGLSILIQAI